MTSAISELVRHIKYQTTGNQMFYSAAFPEGFLRNMLNNHVVAELQRGYIYIYWLWLSHILAVAVTSFCVNVSNTELAKNMTRPVIYGILTCIIMKLLIVFWSRKMSGSEKTDDYIIGLFIPQCIPPWYFVLFIVFWWLLTGCESHSGVLLFYNAEVFLLLLTGWYATTTRMDHCTTF